MPPTRRLTGIAALSAGALATVGLATPATAADVTSEDPTALPGGAATPEEVLHEWEAERGIDVPDDAFMKISLTAEDPPLAEGAFHKYSFQSAGVDGGPALLKYSYGPAEDSSAALLDKASPALLGKIEYQQADLEAQGVLDDLDGLFLKLGTSAGGAVLDDLFHKDWGVFMKLGDRDGEWLTGEASFTWAFAPGAGPTDDAFYKLGAAQDPASGSSSLTLWEYDALDLVEGALLKMGTSSLEGDPDQPLISGLLEQVRELQSAPQRINPFLDRDKAMKGLPLPKKLPSDAGTFSAPKAGLWRSVNLPGTVKCEGYSQRIPRSVSSAVRFELRDGGSTIVGYDLAEPGSKVTLKAANDIQGRFAGTLEMDSEGGRIEMDLTMQVITDVHTVGSATITVKGRGQTCTITRRFDMTFQGQ